VTEETTDYTFLLSGSTLILAVIAFYVGRALWIARRELPECSADTKVLYLLVAPPLTLAVDLLSFTDRLFWAGARQAPAPARVQARGLRQLRPKTDMRSNG
jgi:hypothetical protein